MGQSSSRSQRPTAKDAVAASSSNPMAEFGATGPRDESPATVASTSANPRRPSLRRKVVNLMKSGSLKEKDDGESAPAVGTGERRKSWRSSRRWSKSPVEFYPTQPTVVEDAEEHHISSPEASSSRTPSTPSIPIYDKGKSREDGAVDLALEESHDDPAGERPSTPYPTTTVEAQQNSPSRRSEQPDLEAQRPALEEAHAREAEQPSLAPESEPIAQAETAQPAPPPPIVPPSNPEPRPTPTAAPTRQFPPPGTLVVVQGIVHTTDVSRPNTSSPPHHPPSYSASNESGPAHQPQTNTSSRSEGSTSRARSSLDIFRRPPSRDHPPPFTSSEPSSTSSASPSSAAYVPEMSTRQSMDRTLLDHLRSTGGGSGTRAPSGETPLASTSPSDRSSPSLVGAAGSPPLTDNSRVRPSPAPEQRQRSHHGHQQEQQQNTGQRASTISPGSIDVLGTLLSVAAAATAASLLTGSSEPILSSGLAPPGTPGANAGNSIIGPQQQATAHSSGNASMGGAGAAGGEEHGDEHDANNTIVNPSADNYAASRAERMRQAWSTIRERLGLRPNPPASQPSLGSNGQSTSTHAEGAASGANGSAGGGNGGADGVANAAGTNSPITDTRELMLAEMARAFNIGLGLNGLGGGGPPQNGGAAVAAASEASGANAGGNAQGQGQDGAAGSERGASGQARAEGTLPPAGSFDRFLVDLQADLRIALTQNEDDDEDQRQGQEGVGDPNSTRPTLVRDEGEVVGGHAEGASTRGGVGRVEEGADGDDDMPALLPISDDSDSELDEDADDSEEDEEEGRLFSRPSSHQPLAPPSSSSPILAVEPEITATTSTLPTSTSSTSSTGIPASASNTSSTSSTNMGTGAGRMDASGRINWWRLYRFPAITSPRTYASMSTPTSPASPSPQTFSPAPPPSPTPGAGRNTTPSSLPSAVSLSDYVPEEGSGAGPNANMRARRGNVESRAGGVNANANANAGASSQTQQPFLPNFLPPPSGQTVVPVIVVGLQSVTAGTAWAAEDGGAPHAHGQAHGGATQQHTHGAHAHHGHGPQRQTGGPRDDLDTSLIPTEEEEAEARALLGIAPGADLDIFGQLTSSSSSPAAANRHTGAFEEGDEDDDDDDEDEDDYNPDEDDEDDVDDHIYARAARAAARIGREPFEPFEAARRRRRREDRQIRRRIREQNRAFAAAEGVTEGGEGERRWQRRAASALRDLRRAGAAGAGAGTGAGAGSRSAGAGVNASAAAGTAAATATATATTGSRTFLIYVIGGYYPPDHSIVTGGPETFESFEALLELAEMLGHGKPPTVTKEEIDNSGLETIKPAMLGEYEARGKIASNCTERCLICLDDYEAEDDVRVMSCRHAFHQTCVDKWLQTGRNNCPACRSTGVGAETSA